MPRAHHAPKRGHPPMPPPKDKSHANVHPSHILHHSPNALSYPQSPLSDDSDSLHAKFSKAKELETELDALTAEKSRRGGKSSKKSEEKTNALRLQLCELLSDIIIANPAQAESKDAIGTLWKHCFYGRITEIRVRIMREKSRAKKQRQPGAAAVVPGSGASASGHISGGSSTGGASTGSDANLLDELEKQLKVFLKEAILLYEYLIEKYIKMLLPFSQTQSQSQSQESNGDEEPNFAQESQGDGKYSIIFSLYRMYIHLGDLHRYACSYNQAEECYLKSARMAPGTGNPYNQLAVVAQSHQESLTAVALYFYTRSLMATFQPFETSRSNLVRLFETNRKWIKEHVRDDESHHRPLVNANIMEGGGKANKKMQKEWLHKEKSAMNRKFLAQLVDLQWMIFRGVAIDGSSDDKKVDHNYLLKKMNSVLESFASLLSNASFSEALLCKMMAILAFSVLGAGNEGKLCSSKALETRRMKEPTWNQGVIMVNQALSFSFLMRFCAVLANQAVANISKKESESSKANASTGIGTIRSLGPLLLGFSFAASIYEGLDWFHGLVFFPSPDSPTSALMDTSPINDACTSSHVDFWKSIANLANSLDSAPGRLSSNLPSISHDDIKEFSDFHGFVPFSTFLSKYQKRCTTSSGKVDKRSEYTSVEEVVEILSTKKSISKSGEAETNLKVDLLLSLVDQVTAIGTNQDNATGFFFLAKDSNVGTRTLLSKSTASLNMTSENSKNDTGSTVSEQLRPPIEHEKPEGNDMDGVVILKTSYSESGVPLLVPGNIPGSGSKCVTSQAPKNTGGNLIPGFSSENDFNNQQNSIGLGESTVHAPTLLNINSILGDDDANSGGSAFLNRDRNRSDPLRNVEPRLESVTPVIQQSSPKAPLPPPPGFSVQPQSNPRQSTPANFTNDAGTTSLMSLSHLSGGNETRAQNLVADSLYNPGSQASLLSGSHLNNGTGMPQAGPSYLSPSMFELPNSQNQSPLYTMNPFVQDSPVFPSNSSKAPTPKPIGPAFLNSSNQTKLDQSPLNFLLNSGGARSPDDLASSDALGLLVPSFDDQSQKNESLLKFLFDPNSSSNSGQGAYGSHQHESSTHGIPQTKNPFVR